MQLSLSQQSDALGFFYGQAIVDDDIHQVNVLPPLSEEVLWVGKIRSDEIKPDPKRWIVYIDGEEIARAPVASEVESLILSSIARCA